MHYNMLCLFKYPIRDSKPIMHNIWPACKLSVRIIPLVCLVVIIKIVHRCMTRTSGERALAGVCVFKTCGLYPNQSVYNKHTTSSKMATGIPYRIDTIPPHIEGENELFASQLIKSFKLHSKLKGIFYNISLNNFLLQVQGNILEEGCQPLITRD